MGARPLQMMSVASKPTGAAASPTLCRQLAAPPAVQQLGGPRHGVVSSRARVWALCERLPAAARVYLSPGEGRGLGCRVASRCGVGGVLGCH